MNNETTTRVDELAQAQALSPNHKSPKKKITRKTLSLYFFVGVFLAWPLIQFAIFYVYMNFNNIMLAFKGMRVDGSTYWLTDDLLANFKNVLFGLEQAKLTTSFKNNLLMFAWTTLLGMPLNVLFAYYLYKKKLGHGIIRIIYMVPSMVSGVVIAMLFKQFVDFALPKIFEINKNLLMDDHSAFVIQIFYALWLGFSTSIIIYSNAMFGVDEGMMEAARIDGAGEIGQLWYIMIPNIMPTISTYMITGVASIFTLSGSLFVFYTSANISPPAGSYLMGYYMFEIAQGPLTAYPNAAAISIMITIVSIPITFFVRWLCDRFDPLRDVYHKEG